MRVRCALGLFGLALACVGTDARAVLVSSYYSNQIIVTTDARRSGPVDRPPEVGPAIAPCWRAPRSGDQVTVQLSFRRDGSIFGKPMIRYAKPVDGAERQALAASIVRAVGDCAPLRFTPRLAAQIAGQVFVIRFIAR